MQKKSKWVLAISLATLVAGSSLVLAAQVSDQQDAHHGKRPGIAGERGDFMKRGHGMISKESRAKLLEILNIDAETFKNERKAGKSMLTIATEHGVSEQTLTAFLVEQRQQRLEEAVKAGRITAEKAAQMQTNMEQHVAKMINKEGRMAGHHKHDMSELLTLLNIDQTTLHNEFKQGKSLITIAAEHGVSEQQLRDTCSKMEAERIDKAVAAGRISADKAESMKAHQAEHLEKFLTKEHAGRKIHQGQSQ